MESTTYDAGLQAAAPSASDRQWAAGAHAAALLAALLTSWMAGVAGAAAAAVVWMLVRDKSAFASEHAKEAVNFNLSMLIYAGAAVLAGVVLVGATILTLGLGLLVTLPAGLVLLLALAAIAVAWLVCSVLAIIKAYDGQAYRYPVTIRLLK